MQIPTTPEGLRARLEVLGYRNLPVLEPAALNERIDSEFTLSDQNPADAHRQQVALSLVERYFAQGTDLVLASVSKPRKMPPTKIMRVTHVDPDAQEVTVELDYVIKALRAAAAALMR